MHQALARIRHGLYACRMLHASWLSCMQAHQLRLLGLQFALLLLIKFALDFGVLYIAAQRARACSSGCNTSTCHACICHTCAELGPSLLVSHHLPKQPLPQVVDRVIGLGRDAGRAPSCQRLAHKLLQVFRVVADAWHLVSWLLSTAVSERCCWALGSPVLVWQVVVCLAR